MGASLTILTAALFVGQTYDTGGKNCPCTKSGQGQIIAQPEGYSETRTMSWWNWRGSSSSGSTVSSGATATSEWRTTSPTTSQATAPATEPSWADTRPVLSRIRGWFRRDTMSSPTTEPAPSNSKVVVQPTPVPVNGDSYRRLPTNNEPPLNTPIIVGPGSTKPAEAKPFRSVPAAPVTKPANQPPPPLTIEVEPIEFRTAGQAKGLRTADFSKAPEAVKPEVVKTEVLPSNRPNYISPRFIDKVGQPGDYSWITGQLEIRGNTFILHYASPETVDRYNGSVVLIGNGKMGSLRNGDLISVHGSILQQPGRGVAYQVSSADLVER